MDLAQLFPDEGRPDLLQFRDLNLTPDSPVEDRGAEGRLPRWTAVWQSIGAESQRRSCGPPLAESGDHRDRHRADQRILR